MAKEPIQSFLLFDRGVLIESCADKDVINVEALKELYQSTFFLGKPAATDPWKLQVHVRTLDSHSFGHTLPSFEYSSGESKLKSATMLINTEPVIPPGFDDCFLHRYVQRIHRLNAIFFHEWRHIMDYLYPQGYSSRGIGLLVRDDTEEALCDEFSIDRMEEVLSGKRQQMIFS